MEPERKQASVTATIHLLWDAAELAHYRKTLAEDEEFMARHNEQVAKGTPIWVACHNRRVTLQPDGLLRIGEQTYQVREDEEDDRYLRCVCAGCSFDLDYCQVNHQVRVYEWTLKDLVKKAKRPPTNLADGTVIRFAEPFTLRDDIKCAEFRKGTYRQPVWKNGDRVTRRSTIFYSIPDEIPCHITNWKRLDFEIVSVPQETPGPAHERT